MLFNFYFPRKSKGNSVQGIEEVIFYEKYFFKICPLIGRESFLNDKSYSKKVDGMIYSAI